MILLLLAYLFLRLLLDIIFILEFPEHLNQFELYLHDLVLIDFIVALIFVGHKAAPMLTLIVDVSSTIVIGSTHFLFILVIFALLAAFFQIIYNLTLQTE